jgi:hypothetical protein
LSNPKGFSAMEYKQFVVRAFERESGKWRACVERVDGKVMLPAKHHRSRPARFVTGVDANSAQVAMLMALAAIDAGAFTRPSRDGAATS